ncbi:hypothetical protein H9P43_008727 [Blastocladiella emersonii ATCC 22665]|nr:hypothetical protein H9P43_008727 [Blastocladiella emersonii ATCC 22665]
MSMASTPDALAAAASRVPVAGAHATMDFTQHAQHAPGAPERDSMRWHRAAELVARKRDVVDAHAHTSVWEVLGRMALHEVQAVPVWGEPAHWIAAGGVTATVEHGANKVYIGMVAVADVARWLANFPQWSDAEALIAFLARTPVSDLIGQTPESRSLWIAPADANLVAIMEPLAKGLHRWLVEIRGSPDADVEPIEMGAPLNPAAAAHAKSPSPLKMHHHTSAVPGAAAAFRLCTQTDVVRFIHANRPSFPAVNIAAQQSLESLGLIRAASTSSSDASAPPLVLTVTTRTAAVDAIRLLVGALVGALAVVDAHDPSRIVGSWSWADLRHPDTLVRALVDPAVVVGQLLDTVKPPVLVTRDETLEGVLDRLVYAREHRAWVVDDADKAGPLRGVVSLTDVIRQCLQATLHEGAGGVGV